MYMKCLYSWFRGKLERFNSRLRVFLFLSFSLVAAGFFVAANNPMIAAVFWF